MISTDNQWYMNLALDEANKGYRLGEVPIGAVLVAADGKILAKGHNLKETTHNPCGHAEMLIMQMAGPLIENWRLQDCTLFVTLEPCPMCLAAMVQARIGKLVFGAYDPKGGALSLGYHLNKDSRLNHSFSVMGGVSHYDCSQILSQFFRERRKSHLK